MAFQAALRSLPRFWAGFVIFATLAACGGQEDASAVVQMGDAADRSRLFTLMPSSHTGVTFANRLRDTDEMNVFAYRNYYNGGGAALGDLTGDGLPELVLTANQDGPRLYLNRGEFRFRDVTRASGLRSASGSWTTGVAFADVNGDGRLDLYVCKAGPLSPEERGNELWLNEGLDVDGIPTFREVGEAYGVADRGYTIHAAFLDYDRDGDLDLFVINNSPSPVSGFPLKNVRDERHPHGGAKLFRNDGARFTDVSAGAGIHSPEIAFALGVAVSDVNRDGWPDVYVANDFFERDYLYVNRGDGTFGEALDRQMPVISYFSMGLDIADLDNDGWPDVYTTDMLPEDEHRFKTTTLFEGWDVYQTKVKNGFHHQLMRNMLQRNNRDGTFTDIGEIAGVARTDWSWSALIADLDLDGLKDIFVTNGLAKDITSQDYVAFLGSEHTMREVTNDGRSSADFGKLMAAMTSTPLANYAFRNNGPSTPFTRQAESWGLATPSFSNGAVYGDLDGDGALDLVVNNVNQPAFVYRNNARTVNEENGFLRVRLVGEGTNRFAIGARVTLVTGGTTQMQELFPSRGYQSSVDYTLVFGLGKAAAIDSVVTHWPDGRASVATGISRNATLTVAQRDANPSTPSTPTKPLLALVDSLPFAHRENRFVDFDRERLIPKMLSIEGPAFAVADVNSDGLDDVYVGGAKSQAGQILLQQRNGNFTPASNTSFAGDAISEDVGAAFFDADGDGDRDLYVVSGGNEYSDRAPALQDRLYLNDGRGAFTRTEGRLPTEFVSGSRVVPADYDSDGDVDLFVGGRVVPWRYGTTPRSMLLRNDRGRFTEVAAQLAPSLTEAGMVTDAAWLDIDGDRRLDLVVVGEWMPVTVFRNAGGGRMEPLTVRGLDMSSGWWNRVVAADVTGDGRPDLVLGNLGLNSRLSATPDRPARMHVNDFDRNGFVEQIVSVYNDSVSYPIPLRDELLRALPPLQPRFPKYADYALATVTDIFSADELKDAIVREAHTFATSVARNNGDGSFTLVPLTFEAQIAPVYGILAEDVDGDRRVDLLLAGNFDGFKPEIGRMSSGRGLLLRGDGTGGFIPVHATTSGFVVDGQARDIARLRTASGVRYVIPRNDGRPVVFSRTVRD